MDNLKQKAAEYAVDNFIHSDMVIGLGGGSTAFYAIQRIGNHLASGRLKNVLGIPCSTDVEKGAKKFGVPVATLSDQPKIDLTIDGADEVDKDMNLIKGGGGALLREKIVAQASQREIIIVDPSKISKQLGEKWPVPIEVIPFGWETQLEYLVSIGAECQIREKKNSSEIYITDQKNYIIDANFGVIKDPNKLASKLESRAGIVEHGLFIQLATDLIIASDTGIKHTTR